MGRVLKPILAVFLTIIVMSLPVLFIHELGHCIVIALYGGNWVIVSDLTSGGHIMYTIGEFHNYDGNWRTLDFWIAFGGPLISHITGLLLLIAGTKVERYKRLSLTIIGGLSLSDGWYGIFNESRSAHQGDYTTLFNFFSLDITLLSVSVVAILICVMITSLCTYSIMRGFLVDFLGKCDEETLILLKNNTSLITRIRILMKTDIYD